MKTKETELLLTVKTEGNDPYDIVLKDSFNDLPQMLTALGCEGHRIGIVTDSNVGPIYLEEICKLLEPVASKIAVYQFPAGEENKNLENVQKIYETLIEAGFDRKDYLLALGGGVVGDMTGFAAATYLRGIKFIQVPTTLLSQIDSSIGGKTGVDFSQYKNMVGAFHQPSLVYINISVLKTLPEAQYINGMGELLKHGLILDVGYYEWTIEHMSEIEERDVAIMTEMVSRSCQIKRYVVEKDPKEKGERALLNFGHTIGHAIEKSKNFELLHGECVSLGMVAAAYISWKRGYLDDDEFYEIRDMNVGFGLPISFDGVSSEIILQATKRDKKMDSGKIRFVLLKRLGKSYVDTAVSDEEILNAINYINADVQ